MAKPTPDEVRDFIEGYNVSVACLSNGWIEARRDNFVIPYVERLIRFSLTENEGKVEYLDGTGTDILMLNRKNIISLTKIEYVSGGDNIYDLDINNYVLIEKQGILKARSGRNRITDSYSPFPRGNKNIKITYSCGYSDDDMPFDIKEAIIYLISEQALGFIGGRTGGGALSMQSYSRNYGNRGKFTDIRNDLTRQAMALLQPYITAVGGS